MTWAALIAAALFGIVATIAGWVQRAQAQSAGATQSVTAVSQTTAVTETAVAQAEVAAPATQAAILDRFKQGSF